MGLEILLILIDPKLKIPTRVTVVRRIKQEYEQVTLKIKSNLHHLQTGSIHLIVDIWSTRSKESVLGFETRYLSNWKIHHEVLGFELFSEAHNAENLRSRVTSFLHDRFNLEISHIGSITFDNASNNLAAFKIFDPATVLWSSPFSQAFDYIQENDSDSDDGTWVPKYSDDQVISEDNDDEDWCDILEGEAENDLGSLELNDTVITNGCLAHLLQLAIRDAIRHNVLVKDHIREVNSIVKFFHKSTKWYPKLRQITDGLSLIKPNATRWNSTYHCLKRIFEKTEDRPDMTACINNVLEMARKDKYRPRKTKKALTPNEMTEDAVTCLTIIKDILKPFAELTDDLQGHGVTSSLAISGVINAVKQCLAVTFEETLFNDFRFTLVNSVLGRFSSNSIDGRVLTPGESNRRIVSIDVFRKDAYILATRLDPRIKTTPFRRGASVHESLTQLLPVHHQGLAILQNYAAAEALKNGCNEQNHSSSPGPTNTNTLTPKRKKISSIFAFIDEMNENQEHSGESGEVDEYMNLPLEAGDTSPLEFWKQHERKWPVLAGLALFYLSIPATSESVERLFSIAGTIARSRRFRIKTKLLENVLTVRQHLIIVTIAIVD